MKKVIVYFHGFNSSPLTDKVQQLRTLLPNDYIYSFLADIDPEIAIKNVGNDIDSALLNHLNEDIEIIFIGTSLGGWLAAKLADLYGVKAILINPVFNPTKSLEKYGVDKEIREKYEVLTISPKYQYFLAKHDEVIDHKELIEVLNSKSIPYDLNEYATHRYDGIAFDDTIRLEFNLL